MKERLAAMVKQDEPAKQSLPMSAFHQTIPWRFCFCGGWMVRLDPTPSGI